MLYIANTFTISMLPNGGNVQITPIELEEVKSLLQGGNFTSAVGHFSTAEVISKLLGIEIPSNRISLSLKEGDILIVFQLLIRLEEGKILQAEEILSLLKEGKVKFYKVEVLSTL
jgi:hypothetical protein